MDGKINSTPAFTRAWFWDTNYDTIDWQAAYKSVIPRILERGDESEWKELIRFYGRDKIISALKNEITYMTDYAIEDASRFFSIPKEDMLCYIRKQSRPGRWL